MIHEEKCRPIKAQNLGSHGSKGPHAASNRRTRSLGKRGIDKRRWLGPPTSRPTTMVGRVGPTSIDLQPSGEASYSLPKVGSRCQVSSNLAERPPLALPLNMRGGGDKNKASSSWSFSPFSHLSSSRLVELRCSSCRVAGRASENRYGFAISSLL